MSSVGSSAPVPLVGTASSQSSKPPSRKDFSAKTSEASLIERIKDDVLKEMHTARSARLQQLQEDINQMPPGPLKDQDIEYEATLREQHAGLGARIEALYPTKRDCCNIL